jgi:hypothetical protein
MDKNEILKLKKKLKSLHTKLADLGPLMRGSVVLLGPKDKAKRICFSLNKDGKTKMMYLGKKREEKAKEYSQNHKRLLEIVDEMTIINMTLLKENEAQ